MSIEPSTTPPHATPLPLHAVAVPEPVPLLPVPLSTFVGRGREVAAVAVLVRDPAVRLVTLTGPGGVGKTRLALRVAAEVAGDFADGVAFVELAAVRDPELVVPAIAQALRVRGRGDQPVVAALQSVLRAKVMLLVLDNFEQVVAAGPRLSELLQACPRLKALVTSRALLHVSGERAAPVPPLSLPRRDGEDSRRGDADRALLDPSPARLVDSSEAVRLFVERTCEVRPEFALTEANAADVAEVCRRLDGLPLAIELAAARGHLFAPTALLARLEHRLPQLTDGPRDLPARLQTMHDAIAWSYDLLSPEEKDLFRCLGAFAGGCTIEAAEAVCGPQTTDGEPSGPRQSTGEAAAFDRRQSSVESVVAVVESLARQSLIRVVEAPVGGPRLEMLETVREFAVECLTASGEEAAVREAHAAFVVALAERAKPELETPAAAAWVARLEAEDGNVQAALAWLEDADRWHDLLRLAYVMYAVWGISLRLREARSWLERALDPARADAAPPSLRAGAARGLGWIAMCLGDYAAAEVWLEEALAIRRQLGDVLGVANTLTVLGTVAERRGDDAVAGVRYAEALAGFRAVGHLQGIAWSLVGYADAAYRRGDHGEAARLAEEAMAVARESGNQHQLADALIAFGQAASARADWTPAVAALQEALGLGRDLGSHMACAGALTGLAEVAVAAGEAGRAARLLGVVAALTEAGGLVRPEHPVLYQRGGRRDAERPGRAGFRLGVGGGASAGVGGGDLRGA